MDIRLNQNYRIDENLSVRSSPKRGYQAIRHCCLVRISVIWRDNIDLRAITALLLRLGLIQMGCGIYHWLSRAWEYPWQYHTQMATGVSHCNHKETIVLVGHNYRNSRKRLSRFWWFWVNNPTISCWQLEFGLYQLKLMQSHVINILCFLGWELHYWQIFVDDGASVITSQGKVAGWGAYFRWLKNENVFAALRLIWTGAMNTATPYIITTPHIAAATVESYQQTDMLSR